MDVRLTYRDQNNATGNLEICYNQMWLSACSELFSSSDLQVACRAMGYHGDAEMFQENVSYLNDSRRPFPARLNCDGSESNLRECPTNLTSFSQCSSVRIQCSGKYFLRAKSIHHVHCACVQNNNSVKCTYSTSFMCTFLTLAAFPKLHVVPRPSNGTTVVVEEGHSALVQCIAGRQDDTMFITTLMSASKL